MQVRLQKILAQATDLSRRSAETAIKEGRVRVNGRVVTKLGTKADPVVDKITYGGKLLKIAVEPIYLAFNKPHNTIVSKSDPEGRPTIWDGLPKWMKDNLNSAGRLDFDSEGLLILTNDGDLINYLTHPSKNIWKTYMVKVSNIPSKEAVEKLRHGVELDDGPTAPAKVDVVRQVGHHTWLEMSIREGRNRQVRRMCDAIGHSVLKLRRIAIGQIKLGRLKAGECRRIKEREILVR